MLPTASPRSPRSGGRIASSLRAGVALLLLGLPRAASAQDAISLFEQGKKLANANRCQEAVPLFSEAHRLQPAALGITLNLADCEKKVGLTASAWSAFREAEFIAKKGNDAERAQFAHDQAAALEPLLSRLRIDAEATPGLIVHRDEQEIGKGLLGTAFPVDPGPHKIEATAPGHLVWTTTVVIGPERDLKTVTIPALGQADAGAGAPGRPFAWNGQRYAGLGLAAGGVVTLVVGGVLGGLAASKNASAKVDCGASPSNQCTAAGVSLRDSAGKLADESTGLLAGGGAAAAAGIILFATARSDGGARTGGVQRVGASPIAAAGLGGLLLRGTW